MNILVKWFEDIRDISYKIPLTLDDEDFCCSWKAILLKKFLEAQNIESRYRVCAFEWTNISLPEELMMISHENESTHVYLEVLIDGVWFDVDPTWDSWLRQIFSIASWDGISSTSIAVPVWQLLTHEQSREIMENINPEEIQKDLEINGAFYKAFNAYLESVRHGV